jgi:hypothetical protein
MFSKGGSLRNEHWRDCMELDDKDRALLNSHTSAELRTQSVVWRSGVLDLLPKRLDDCWPRFGTVMVHNVIGTWNGGNKPVIGKGGHNVWIIPECKSSEALANDSVRRLRRKSDPVLDGMRSYDLPTVVKLLEIHGGVAQD